jgi:hypothetical protein
VNDQDAPLAVFLSQLNLKSVAIAVYEIRSMDEQG